MPIREYICKKCGKKIEVLVFNKKEEKEIKCDKCGSEVERIMSKPAKPVIV
jgi:putative FmdB family regulatory protein